jgi:hypothetical protein
LFLGKPQIWRRLPLTAAPVGVVALVEGVEGPPGSDDGDVFVVTPVGASSLETFIGSTDMWAAWWLGIGRWWSGASSYTSMAADLGGVVQWRLGVQLVVMDSCRRTMLSGIMVELMAERPGKVDASVSDLRMD